MNLDDWRSRINDLDNQLLNLLNQRAEAALRIGDLKRRKDLAYFVPEREAEIVDRLVTDNGGPLPAGAVRATWREILSASLALERPLRVAYAAHLPDVAVEEVASTAAAAALAAQEPTVGAVASDLAARLYDVPVLRPRIEDSANNSTRFLVIGRRAMGPTGRDKTSILFSMRN